MDRRIGRAPCAFTAMGAGRQSHRSVPFPRPPRERPLWPARCKRAKFITDLQRQIWLLDEVSSGGHVGGGRA